MNKKILLFGLVVLGILMCASTVSAYGTYSASWPQIVRGESPYPWVTVGGRTATSGGFASSYMANLIPGTYYGPPCICGNSVAYYDASRPCTCGNSGGSWFGGGYGGYGSNYGGYGGNYNNYGSNYGYGGNYNNYGSNYGWGGAWGNYGNYNTYGGNVGWASNYPSYNYNYMYNGYV